MVACVLEPVPDRRHGEVQLGGERRALLLARLFGSWLKARIRCCGLNRMSKLVDCFGFSTISWVLLFGFS